MKHLRGYLTAAVFAGITYVLSLYGKQFTALIDMVYPYVIRTLEATLAQWSSQVDFLLWQFLAVALGVVLIACLVVVIVTKKSVISWFGWVLAAASFVFMLHTLVYGMNYYAGDLSEDLRLRKDMQNELKRIQQALGITFIYVTHDQEEALSMSDTIVVMDKGRIQQIGKPEDIYNEPKNAFVADFIGESNILDGVMLSDYRVKFFDREFQCVDKGFAENEPVDVVIRPEDVDIVPVKEGHLVGKVTAITFKGLNYDIIVEFKGFKWLIQSTDYQAVGSTIGIRLNPEDIHIMHKSEYSGMFGDYSSYSAEYDELTEDAGNEEE